MSFGFYNFLQQRLLLYHFVFSLYISGENPQYKLQVNVTEQNPVVWILLTRHITDRVSQSRHQSMPDYDTVTFNVQF